MALRIRLARFGRTKRPFYRVVVAEHTAPRDGRFADRVGFYDPMLPQDNPKRVHLEAEKIKYWIGVGAKPQATVMRLMKQCGLIEA